ncbi:MAG: hypothetical protein FWC73_06845 [Defluviitaleaceae bacterium]|nr:hypothetical protein [Defluviitaleaceae bacterium]
MDSFLWVSFGAAILITIILVVGYIISVAIKSTSNRSPNCMEVELNENIVQLRTEMAAIKEELASISKMMKEVG